MDATSTPSPSADAVYLRRLLERQPGCLLRVRLDGVLLACNDAGLGLFGVRTLAAILKTNLADRIAPADLTKWHEFTARVWGKGAASLETYLVVDNDVRPVLVQGIALKDHPGGVESLLLHLRDQSVTHQLERSLRSAEISRAGQEERQRAARDQVEQAIVERMQLAAIADQHQAEHEAERHRLIDALETEIADRHRRQVRFAELESKLEESQLASLARARDERGGIARLEAEVAALHAAQAINASARDAQDAQRQQEEAASAERDRKEVAELHRRLQMATAEVERAGALAVEHEGQRKQMAAEHHAAVHALDQALARAREEAALSRNEASEVMAAVRAQQSGTSAEQSRLAARVKEHELERDGMIAEHRQLLSDLESKQSDALAGLRIELSQALTEQGRLTARAEELERERDRTAEEYERERDRTADELERQRSRTAEEHERERSRSAEEHGRERDRLIAGHQRAVAGLQTAQREALSELRAQLSEALAEQSRLSTRAEEQERERDRTITDHQALADLEHSAREALAALRAQLAQMLTERSVLAARVEDDERERNRMSAEHHQALANLETSKREALAGLREQLAQTMAEQHGLAARLEADERERDRMSAEHHQALANLEASKRAALAGLREQLAQTTAEQHGLAARLEADERDRDRMHAEHHQALASLETSKRAALAGLREELTQMSSRQNDLTARIEQDEREHERTDVAHRRAISDLLTSKRDALVEWERVLTGIQQALLATDQASAEIERRILEVIDEAARQKAAARLAALERPPIVETINEAATDTAGRTPVVTKEHTVPTDVGMFDAADATFVRHLIEGIDQSAPKAADREDPVFDAEDDSFVRGLIDRNHWPPESPSPREDL